MRKIPVGGESPGAGSIGCNSLVCPRLQRIRTRESKVCQRAGRVVNDDSGVVEDFLKLSRSGGPLARCQVNLASHIRRLQNKK